MSFQKILKISRPRFWVYILGPFLIGATVKDYSLAINNIYFWLFLIYFTFPANILIYGINDIFDYETDKLNPKKVKYEAFVSKKEHKSLWKIILYTNIPFWIILPFLNINSIIFFVLFLFFSIQYSAKPIRAKAIPVLDSIFNILYIMPAIFGYFITQNTNLDIKVILAGFLWSMAMHSYSAIPDIKADRDSKTSTIATLFGFNLTVLYCFLLYSTTYILSINYLGIFAHLFGFIYLSLMILTYLNGYRSSFSIYKLFPIINTSLGFLLFWILIYNQF